jgi:thymidine phosphorylase
VVTGVPAAADGYLVACDAREIGLAANALGAGRKQLGDPVDPAVGFVFRARLGERVSRGEPIAEVHAQDENAAAEAVRRVAAAWTVAPDPQPVPPRILARVEPA